MGLISSAKIAFGFFHASEDTAYADFVQVYKQWMDISPFFKNELAKYSKLPIRLISSGFRSKGSVIGSQLLYTVLSEISFVSPVDANNKINEVLIRYGSRFSRVRHFFGGVVCDSSAKESINDAAQKFEESVPEHELFKVHPSIWQVKPFDYVESKGQYFEFYRGDNVTLPHVMTEEELADDTIDKDRVIKVPIQLKFNFENDATRSLQDLAGISYSNQDLLFSGDLSHVFKCASIRNLMPDVISTDFYDMKDTIYSKAESMIDFIPRNSHLFIHFDIGLKRDTTGVAITCYDGEKIDSNTDASYPKFKNFACFGISRVKGQSTSLDHIFQFIIKLMDKYTLTVSFDSFASQGLLQSLQRLGDQIETKLISVDRTTNAYFMLKNIINSERLTMVANQRLFRELSELRIVTVGNHVKVDHPLVSQCTDFDYKNIVGEMPGGKDLSDALAGSIWSAYQNYSERMESGYSGSYKTEINAIKKITPTDAREQVQKHFQSMLEDIF